MLALCYKSGTDLLFSQTKESGHSEALIVMAFPISSQSRFRNSSIFISHTFCTSHLSISQLTLALLLLFSLSNGVWCCRRLRGDVVCVFWWVVRAVHRRSGQAESNCRCCGAKVIRRAGRGKLNKHHPRQECFHSEQLSACPVYLLHNYHPPQGNSMEQHDHPLGDEEGPRGRRDGQYHRGR